MLVQIVSNAAALGLTALLLPGIHMSRERVVLELLAAGFIFGLLNAFIRPILQFIMFQFLFITFGLVLIAINYILLWLLARLTPGWFWSDGFLWSLAAAILVGLLGVFIETLLGLRPPIRDDASGELDTQPFFSLGSVPIHLPAAVSHEPTSQAELARAAEAVEANQDH